MLVRRIETSWVGGRTPLSLILSILYGWTPITDINDPLIQEIKENIDKLAYAALPGSYLIDLFPSLIHIPRMLSKWKQEGQYYYERNTALVEGFIDDVRKKRAEVRSCTLHLMTCYVFLEF